MTRSRFVFSLAYSIKGIVNRRKSSRDHGCVHTFRAIKQAACQPNAKGFPRLSPESASRFPCIEWNDIVPLAMFQITDGTPINSVKFCASQPS
jgi:hypothetical protein